MVLDLGCGRGHVSKHVLAENVGFLYQCDMAEHVLVQQKQTNKMFTNSAN